MRKNCILVSSPDGSGRGAKSIGQTLLTQTVTFYWCWFNTLKKCL